MGGAQVVVLWVTTSEGSRAAWKGGDRGSCGCRDECAVFGATGEGLCGMGRLGRVFAWLMHCIQ